MRHTRSDAWKEVSRTSSDLVRWLTPFSQDIMIDTLAGARETDAVTGQYTSNPDSLVKRVLFVAGIEEAPLRYRAYLPAEALSLFNISSHVCFHTEPRLEILAKDADLVVLYRVRATRRLLELISNLRSRGVRVLFDVDDLIFD